jgi:2-hydroxychromene-2-carboxylate isomerase
MQLLFGLFMSDIEYFYASYSGFAYLGSARFYEIATAANRNIIHRPIDLRVVVKAAAPSAFGQRSKAHIDYYFGREIARWSEHRNAPIMDGTPTHHANDITLSNCTLIAGIEQGHNIDQLAHAMLHAHWREDADLDNPDTLLEICNSVGLDANSLLDLAIRPEIKAIYKANTQEAIDRSVFGSPTYFIDGDMFYGQDRLEMIERALEKPFAGSWPLPSRL